jgi:hypothetical protein
MSRLRDFKLILEGNFEVIVKGEVGVRDKVGD